MAINNINHLAGNRLQSGATSQGGASQGTTPAASGAPAIKTDSVSLTSEAQQLQQMHKSLHNAPTGNESRVERLKQAVASGEYKVDSERVAKKLFGFETELDKRLG